MKLTFNESALDAFFKKPIEFKGISIDGIEHSVSDLGLGYIRMNMLNIIKNISLNDNHENIIIIIDEPEAFLHPSLIKEVCNTLKDLIINKKITILLTTHSTYVLSNLKSYLKFLQIAKIVNNKLNLQKLSKKKYNCKFHRNF